MNLWQEFVLQEDKVGKPMSRAHIARRLIAEKPNLDESGKKWVNKILTTLWAV
jgi:hypothetical protein